ncbi:uncharacterized protein LOC116013235 [Ipomoea triloba]|uniref:uncharacterized protein LOC116013235 n=1 Tax=Ipomoea triloba TaxID=35885 RepID=UPI00125E0428|nr:uncharacterized protein LOC116013235 [Ipomoea triloba]
MGLNFVQIAEEYASKIGEKYIVCSCCDCRNLKKFRGIDEIKSHLIRRGFKEGYDSWIWHGENVPFSTDDVELDVEKDKRKEDTVTTDEDNDRLDELMRDMQGDLNELPQEFETFFENSGKPLFSGCSKFTKLSSMLKLYNLKANNRWSDKSFTELLKLLKDMLPDDKELLKLLKDMLPDDNELPCSTYEAKKMLCPLPCSTYEAKKMLCPLSMDIYEAKKMLCPLSMDIDEAKKMLCPLSMDIERIHACPNDCILYWKQYKDLHVCPKCGASRYKRKGYDDACEKKKGAPAKVLWYLPVIPRFKRLFANPNDANNLQWHAVGRKEDGKLRHPSDSPQWKNINMKFPEFGFRKSKS